MMQRIRTVLAKLSDLAQRKSDRSVIEIDLMLDYTRVLYADLLEIRSNMMEQNAQHQDEPTLDELTAAMERREAEARKPQQTPAFARETTPAAPQPVVVMQPAPAPVQAPVAVKPVVHKGDIRSLIDLNDKYLFLSEFFGNDMRAYEEAMGHLNKLGTEQEALHYLGHKLDGSDASITFRTLINRFYAG